MSRTLSLFTGAPLARFSIWTIVHHDWLAAHIRFYVWYATATVLFLSLAGIISLQIALFVILFGGLCLLIFLWLLIQWRKSILMNIGDEKVKHAAHAAMLALIYSRHVGRFAAGDQKDHRRRWVKNKSHP